MNSVLLHEPDQSNPHNGRYVVSLAGVCQTLHDRLIEALQKWVPPEESHISTEPDQSLGHYESLSKSLSSSPPPPSSVPSPLIPSTTNSTKTDAISTEGVHIDLTNLHLLLAKSAQLSSSSFALPKSPQPQSDLKIRSGTPTLTDSSKQSQSYDGSSTENVSVSEQQAFRSPNFYSPLSVCTAGPQYSTPDSVSNRLHNPAAQPKVTPTELSGHHKSYSDSDSRSTATCNSSNLLHQLLSGADVTQVRNRSGLLEPSLCRNQCVDSKLTRRLPELKRLTPTHLCIKNAPGDSEPLVKQNFIPFASNTIPVSNVQLLHSPVDTTSTTSANLGTSTSDQSSLVYQSLSSIVSTLAPAVPSDSALIVEKLLYVLLELQKSHTSANLTAMSMSTSPRANTSPRSTLMDGPETPRSLNSPVCGLPPVAPNGSSTPTPTDNPDATDSAHYLRQVLTTSCSSSEFSNPLSVKWSSPQQLSLLKVGRQQQPVARPLLRPEAINCAYSPHVISTHATTDIYEARPRSNSDIPCTTRRRLRITRDFRSRSQAKLECADAGSFNGPFVGHFPQSESESTCELESSLFAQLILSPDSPSSTNSHSTGSLKSFCNANNQGDTRNAFEPQSIVSSQDTARSPIRTTTTNITAKSDIKADESPPPPPPSSPYTCHSGSRTQVFEWLRESDLFVAEHCFDIPLGALLATAISPARSQWAEWCCSALFTSNPPSDPVPGLTKHVINKLWHQLLLVCLIENNFRPQCVTTTVNLNCAALMGVSDPNTSGPLSVPVSHARFDSHHHHHAQPLRDKILNAISSLAALDMEESPAPDAHLVSELHRLVAEGTRLKLTPELFRLIRYCILAQNAYPHHFSTTYSEALSELEAELTNTAGAAALTDVLKLLNHLHCFDAETLKQFFGLSTDPIPAVSTLCESSTSEGKSNNASASELNHCDQQHTSSFNLGNFKRKANGIDDLLYLHREGITERDPNPVQVRSRAYTTTECNKSARLSTTMPDSASDATNEKLNTSSQGRPRSDTVPRVGRHPRRPERPWRFGIR